MTLLRQTLAEERHEPIPADVDPTPGLTRIVDRNLRMRAFLLRFLDPEDLGYAVSEGVRDDVRAALGMPKVRA